MSRSTVRILLAGAACAVAPVLTGVALTPAATATQPSGYGPSSPFIEALLPSHGPVEPMKDQSKIIETTDGYRLTSGQQDNHIRITEDGRTVRFRDTATRSWNSLPDSCTKLQVKRGISAVCTVPNGTSVANPLLLEVHPRLGDDFTNGRKLSAAFQLAVLCDAGNDTVFGGRGDDFVNGAHDPDVIRGGAGNDWIRGGTGDDRLSGGAGNDYIVGQDGTNTISGGAGVNRIFNR